jgi:3-phenylpropionate/trans-cinnamate dioxygenase ferredoxin component
LWINRFRYANLPRAHRNESEPTLTKTGLAVVTEGPERVEKKEAVFQRIASVDELEPYGQFSKWVDDHDILVFRKNGEVKALSNVCPHFGGPVGYHQMRDGVFTCLWHNYRFEAESGQCLTSKHMCLRAYKVKVEDGGIWVQLVEN